MTASWQRQLRVRCRGDRRRMREVPPPVERRWTGELEVWLKPMAGREYLVAVDPAGGGSEGDYAAMQVLDAATGLQCAEFQGDAVCWSWRSGRRRWRGSTTARC